MGQRGFLGRQCHALIWQWRRNTPDTWLGGGKSLTDVVQVEFVIPERAAAKSQRWPLVPPQALPRASDSLHLKITVNGLQ
jgi:hypothetical protein